MAPGRHLLQRGQCFKIQTSGQGKVVDLTASGLSGQDIVRWHKEIKGWPQNHSDVLAQNRAQERCGTPQRYLTSLVAGMSST